MAKLNGKANNNLNQLEEKEYYIAYFDILGYRDFFSKASKEQIHKIISSIYNAISGTKDYLEKSRTINIISLVENLDVKFLGFSDNFAFAIEVEEGECEIYRLLGFLSIIADIQRNFLLKYGLLVRGGITKAKAYIYDNFIHGQGIIDAVQLEHDAIYPQIIIDSTIHSEIHRLHFLTDEELEYGKAIQKKIDGKSELSDEEKRFLQEIQVRYNKESLALSWKDMILIRSNDNRACLNYMYNIGVTNLFYEANIPFDMIKNMIQQLDIHIPFNFPKKGDAEVDVQKHKLVLVDKIKRYGTYLGIDVDNASEVQEREKIIAKYLWLGLFHKEICKLYKMPEYDVEIILGVEPKIMKQTISVLNEN